MQRLLVIAVLCAASTADAAPRRVLVMRAEGKVSAAAKKKIDAAMLAIARRHEATAEQADITFADAQTAVGCTGDVAACKDAVMDTFGADELVVVSVAPASRGTATVQVRRASKGAPPLEASATVQTASPDSALAIQVERIFETEPAPEPVPPPAPLPAPPAPVVTAAPAGVVDTPPSGGRSRVLPIAGLATGTALVAVGIVLWSGASSKQQEIDDLTVRTRDDFEHLKDLESTADSYALWGNVTFFTGIAVAGVSGYFLFFRGGGSPKREPSAVSITPALVPGGAGVTLTVGGGR